MRHSWKKEYAIDREKISCKYYVIEIITIIKSSVSWKVLCSDFVEFHITNISWFSGGIFWDIKCPVTLN